MLTVIHGDNQLAVHSELEHLKKSLAGREIRLLNGRNATMTDLVQALESEALFGSQPAVIIEQLFTRFTRKNKETETLVNLLISSSGDREIVVFEPKEIAPSICQFLAGFKHVIIKLHKSAPVIFAYLDNFRPGLKADLLARLETALIQDAPELVFSLLVRRVRQLILAKDRCLPSTLPAWQASRLTSQSSAFTMEQLLVIYRHLREFEYSWKSGRTPLTVSDFLVQLSVTV
jgi:hypothetical protein